MRVVFCGSGSFATPSLHAIIDSDHDLVGVVTQPPRRAGRGSKVRATAVADLARETGLPLLETDDINAAPAVEVITAAKPDAICVAEFGQMIAAHVREIPAIDTFNVHASLLPELRGAAPVNWAIIRGYTRTGVTTFSLVDRMDAGAMYLKSATDIVPGETAGQLRIRLAELGATTACETLNLLAGGWAHGEVQDDGLATFARRLKKADGIINWTHDARTICNLVHGTWPWPGAHAVFGRPEERMLPVTIASAAVVGAPADDPVGHLDSDLTAATGSGRLAVREIKPAGKRLMSWHDFVNGYRVSAGDCFVDPRTIDND